MHYPLLVVIRCDNLLDKNIDEAVETIMAPFDEEFEVKPYIRVTKAEMIESVRNMFEDERLMNAHLKDYRRDPVAYEERCDESFVSILKKYENNESITDEECYLEGINEFMSDIGQDEDGNMLTVYNEGSKFFRYEIADGDDLFGPNDDGYREIAVDVENVDFSNLCFPPYAFLMDGEWYESGTLSCSLDDATPDYSKVFREKMLGLVPGDKLVVLDCYA